MAAPANGHTSNAAGLFVLDVFVHSVELRTSNEVPPCAVGFQFLDYPVLMVYGKAPQQPKALDAKPQTLPFSAGKSCVFKADPDEIQFLVQQVRRNAWATHSVQCHEQFVSRCVARFLCALCPSTCLCIICRQLSPELYVVNVIALYCRTAAGAALRATIGLQRRGAASLDEQRLRGTHRHAPVRPRRAAPPVRLPAGSGWRRQWQRPCVADR